MKVAIEPSKVRGGTVGELISANFKTKLIPRLSKYKPENKNPGYQKEIFSELFSRFPQFKAHVAAYTERNYCVVINDEDHSSPEPLFDTLSFDEIHMLNKWIIDHRGSAILQRK